MTIELCGCPVLSRYTYIEDEEEEPVKKPALPGASAVQPPVVPQRTPVSALRPGNTHCNLYLYLFLDFYLG